MRKVILSQNIMTRSPLFVSKNVGRSHVIKTASVQNSDVCISIKDSDKIFSHLWLTALGVNVIT